MTSPARRLGPVLLCIFAASGFAGLIYESIWTQYLGLLLGHSAYAQVLVLALFMGGMALGAWLVSRKTESFARPLAVYAAVELALGVFGIGFHAYYRLVSSWAYDSLFPALAPGMPLDLARWTVAGALILPQCVLLGATFPLMSAGYLRWRPTAGGEVLAGLYFSNSLGAAAGALISTFALLPAVGLPGTVLTAGMVNIAAALAVWPLAKLDQPLQPRSTATAASNSRGAATFLLVAAAITGASSFVYEISWVRMLSMVLGGTIHAFELMLAAFITGIAFGGLWLRKRADRLGAPRRAAGWAQIAMGLFAVGTLFVYNQSFAWVAWALTTLNRASESAYTLYNVASAAISLIVMFPAAFCAGMTLPLLTLTLLKEGAGEAAIGKAYAANTLGAIVGVVLAVFFGLPLLGLRLSLWWAAAADIALGVGLLLAVGRTGWPAWAKPNRQVLFGTGLSVAVLALALGLTQFDPFRMSSAVFRFGRYSSGKGLQLLSHQDGRTASVTLREVLPGQRSIFTNGKPDASIVMTGGKPSLDEMTMIVAGLEPMLHVPAAKTAAIIGFGSGMTTHTVLGNPAIEAVDTIEIEPAMVEAAKHFRPVVERAFSDPRSHIVVDDAKSYLATTRKRYDIIISEPSNPWVNGVASLFTEEFYAFVPRHLNKGGVFAQWVQAYEISPALISSILRAMLPHFADVRIFSAGRTDWLIVASPSGNLPDIATLDFPSAWSPALRDELRRQGIDNAGDLSLLFNGGKEILETYAELYPGGGTNSDFFPVLQLGSAKSRFLNLSAVELEALRLTDWPLFETLTGTKPPPIGHRFAPPLYERNSTAFAVRKAQDLYTAIMQPGASQASSDLTLTERLAIDNLRLPGAACNNSNDVDDALVVMSDLATKTAPFLPVNQAMQLWQHASWLGCQPADPFARKYLTVIGAVAARDFDSAEQTAEALLGDPEHAEQISRVQAVHTYLLGAAQTSAYALGDFRKVVSLEQKYGKGAAKDFARTFLLQIASKKAAKDGAK